MTDFLIKKFIADGLQFEKPAVREKYGLLAGSVGIAANLLLFAMKLVAGLLSGGISIIADAFNNLSDAGSSIVTLLGFRLAGKPADELHPFGHGRMEYLAGLFIAVAIILVGWELFRTSVGKIFVPEEMQNSPLAVVILLVSIGAKFWLGFFYKRIGRRIQSAAIEAAAADSFNDCLATAVVLLSLAVNYFAGVNIDGLAGSFVACYIFYSGVLAVKDTVQPLLGQAPDPDFVRKIEEMALATEHIEGLHDLMVHDYGPGRCFISLHAEIAASLDMMLAHEIIDAMEYKLQEAFHCQITVHMDPIELDDPQTLELSGRVGAIVRDIDPALSMHDFRLTHGGQGLKLIFDVLAPHSCAKTDEAIRQQIRTELGKIDKSYSAVIRVDRSYTG